jgi:hypothetical protein
MKKKIEEKFLMKKKAITVIRPKLSTAMTKTKIKSRKSLRGINLDREEDECLSLNNFFLNRHVADNSTTNVCTRDV